MYEPEDVDNDSIYDSKAHQASVSQRTQKAALSIADQLEPFTIRDEDGNIRSLEEPDVRRYIMAEKPEVYQRWLHALDVAAKLEIQQKHDKAAATKQQQRDEFLEKLDEKKKHQNVITKQIQNQLTLNRAMKAESTASTTARISENRRQQQEKKMKHMKEKFTKNVEKMNTASEKRNEQEQATQDQMQRHLTHVKKQVTKVNRQREVNRRDHVQQLQLQAEEQNIKQQMAEDERNEYLEKKKRREKRKRAKRRRKEQQDLKQRLGDSVRIDDDDDEKSRRKMRRNSDDDINEDDGSSFSSDFSSDEDVSTNSEISSSRFPKIHQHQNEKTSSSSVNQQQQQTKHQMFSSLGEQEQQRIHQQHLQEQQEEYERLKECDPSILAGERLHHSPRRPSKQELEEKLQQHEIRLNALMKNRAALYASYAMFGTSRTTDLRTLAKNARETRQKMDKKIEKKYKKVGKTVISKAQAEILKNVDDHEQRRKEYLERVVEQTKAMRKQQNQQPHQEEQQEEETAENENEHVFGQQQEQKEAEQHQHHQKDEKESEQNRKTVVVVVVEEKNKTPEHQAHQQHEANRPSVFSLTSTKNVGATTKPTTTAHETSPLSLSSSKNQQQQQQKQEQQHRQSSSVSPPSYLQQQQSQSQSQQYHYHHQEEDEEEEEDEETQRKKLPLWKREPDFEYHVLSMEEKLALKKLREDQLRDRQHSALVSHHNQLQQFRVETHEDIEKRAKSARKQREVHHSVNLRRLQLEAGHRSDVQSRFIKEQYEAKTGKLQSYDEELNKKSFIHFMDYRVYSTPNYNLTRKMSSVSPSGMYASKRSNFNAIDDDVFEKEQQESLLQEQEGEGKKHHHRHQEKSVLSDENNNNKNDGMREKVQQLASMFTFDEKGNPIPVDPNKNENQDEDDDNNNMHVQFLSLNNSGQNNKNQILPLTKETLEKQQRYSLTHDNARTSPNNTMKTSNTAGGNNNEGQLLTINTHSANKKKFIRSQSPGSPNYFKNLERDYVIEDAIKKFSAPPPERCPNLYMMKQKQKREEEEKRKLQEQEEEKIRKEKQAKDPFYKDENDNNNKSKNQNNNQKNNNEKDSSAAGVSRSEQVKRNEEILQEKRQQTLQRLQQADMNRKFWKLRQQQYYEQRKIVKKDQERKLNDRISELYQKKEEKWKEHVKPFFERREEPEALKNAEQRRQEQLASKVERTKALENISGCGGATKNIHQQQQQEQNNNNELSEVSNMPSSDFFADENNKNEEEESQQQQLSSKKTSTSNLKSNATSFLIPSKPSSTQRQKSRKPVSEVQKPKFFVEKTDVAHLFVKPKKEDDDDYYYGSSSRTSRGGANTNNNASKFAASARY